MLGARTATVAARVAGFVVVGVLGGLLVPAAVVGQEDPLGGVEVRIVARKAADGRVEFGLRQRLADDSWGEIQLPSRRFFPTNVAVGRWLQSSPLTLSAPQVSGVVVRVVARKAADGRIEFGIRQRLGDDMWGETHLPPRRFFPTTAAGGRWLQSAPLTLTTLAPAGGEPQEFVSVAVGGDRFGCGLRADGSVRCWGHGPSSVSPEGEFLAIAAGPGVNCGVRVGGALDCWGGNHHVWAADRLLLEAVPVGSFAAVDVGSRSACGVESSGELVCWGSVGSTWQVPGGRFSAVAVGLDDAACGIGADGAVVCWGDSAGAWEPPGGRFQSIDVASRFACGVRVSGEVLCWGSEPGPGWIAWSVPRGSPPEGAFVDVTVNDHFACAIGVDGAAHCWGPQGEHPCGADYTHVCWGWTPHPAAAGPFRSLSVANVVVRWTFSSPPICGVPTDGRIVCWNYEEWNQSTPWGRFVSIDAHGRCGVHLGGEVVCWRDRVEYVMADGDFTTMGGSLTYGCALRVDGEIACWGSNSWGAASPPPGPFTALDVAYSPLACALRPDGDAVCWGRNDDGQMDAPSGPFTAIRVRSSPSTPYVCGLRPNATTICWGSPSSATDPFALLDFLAPDSPWRESFPGGTFEVVDEHAGEACGIRPGGELVCWSPRWPPGAWERQEHRRAEPGELGQLRHPELGSRGVPKRLEWVQGDIAGGPYTSLASGWFHTCGLRRDGTVDCWGESRGSPDGRYTAISLDSHRGFGIRLDGEIVSWLTGGSEPYATVPLAGWVAPAGQRFVTLSDGSGPLCGLLDNGGVLCSSHAPEPDEHSGPFRSVSAGSGLLSSIWTGSGGSDDSLSTHVCALGADGAIECWGDNDTGQTQLPAPWLDKPPYSDIAAGGLHTCAIGNDGDAICWGNDGRSQTQSPPGPYTALSAGKWHTCGLRPDGDIECWGNGIAEGYDDPPVGYPTEPPLGAYTALAAGAYHTCALRPDGSATCWLSY